MRKKTAEAVLCKRKLSVLLLGYLYKRNPVMLVQIRAVSRNDRLTHGWHDRIPDLGYLFRSGDAVPPGIMRNIVIIREPIPPF